MKSTDQFATDIWHKKFNIFMNQETEP